MRDSLILWPGLGTKSGDRESLHSVEFLGTGSRVSSYYIFDNEFPGFAAIHREGTDPAISVSIIEYAVPEEKVNPRLIFVTLDDKYFLVELWGVHGRYVVTAELDHRGKLSEQQRQVPLTIVEAQEQ